MDNKDKKAAKVLIIAGPTAVGKTAFACHAADVFQGEIISCDSMQIYKGMDIGTAKPGADELKEHPHHLLDIVDPASDFSAARYSKMARDMIEEVSGRGRLPVICGGTGLYLDGILYEMEYGRGPEDEEFRKAMEELAENEGPLALYNMLRSQDPKGAENIHPNNTKRMIRALERIHLGEKNLKPFREENRENPGIDPLLIGLSRGREELYERINMRVDQMMAAGLVREVQELMGNGLGRKNMSMQAIGYKEVIDYIEGLSDIEETVRRIKSSSRHYAKRQFTWFKRYDKMKWIDISEYGSDENAMLAMDDIIREWLRKP